MLEIKGKKKKSAKKILYMKKIQLLGKIANNIFFSHSLDPNFMYKSIPSEKIFNFKVNKLI